jgi:DNA-binding PadR family transcriptional regulator
MAPRRPLTELEGTVLGVVWARQPCTPYRVRREFLDSPSPYWSGSAGAIYPLIERLEAAGLISGTERATGARVGREYRVTAAGRRALRRWVGPPLDDVVIGVPPDPLRARIAFMNILPAAEQQAMLREIETRMRGQLARARRSLAAGDPGGHTFDLMARGAVAMLQTRVEWIASVRRALAPRRSLRVREAPQRTQ